MERIITKVESVRSTLLSKLREAYQDMCLKREGNKNYNNNGDDNKLIIIIIMEMIIN